MLAIDGAISTHANVHNIRLRPGWRLRIELKRTGIFTFLDYDGVPWNNNNAEHAVRAFTRLRTNAIGTSTPKGTREYVHVADHPANTALPREELFGIYSIRKSGNFRLIYTKRLRKDAPEEGEQRRRWLSTFGPLKSGLRRGSAISALSTDGIRSRHRTRTHMNPAASTSTNC